jgi:NAD(P)-dependent dehydrogenase (short-subunit alcohol dehydrogenase family)
LGAEPIRGRNHQEVAVPLDETTTAGEVMAGVDLSGQTAIVTGASTGIGLETAANLAAAGARVIAGVRTEEKGKATVATLADRVKGAAVDFGVIDLTSFASIRTFAAGFVGRDEPLHLLINNAGVMNTPFEHTVEGYELQFGTNHLGHFLLTNLLVPTLIAGAPARVVNLSSGGHRSSDIHWDDPNFEHHPYDKMAAYGQSKTANILFSVELDRRLADRGVHAYAVHPGRINTELARYMDQADYDQLIARMKESGRVMPPRKSIEAGAATSLWAATAPELADRGGLYLEDCHVSEALPYATDLDAAARLWTLSEELVGESFPL